MEVDHIQSAIRFDGLLPHRDPASNRTEASVQGKEEADRLLRWLQIMDRKLFSFRELNRNGNRFARENSSHATKLLVLLSRGSALTADHSLFLD